MYSTNEKKVVEVLVDDFDLQSRLFTNFNETECKELVHSIMEVEILHRIYGYIFNQFVERVHSMFGENQGDVLIDIYAKMKLAKKELEVEEN